MTDFTVTITDAQHLVGLSAARARYNESATTPIDTDAAYVQHVMERAAESYYKQAVAEGAALAGKQAVESGLSVADVETALAAAKG